MNPGKVKKICTGGFEEYVPKTFIDNYMLQRRNIGKAIVKAKNLFNNNIGYNCFC